MNDPHRIKDLLQGVGERLGFGGAIETGLVWSRWNDIVGDTVAAHAEPTSLREGVLRVRTDSPTWATEVGYLGQEIKRAANQVAGVELVSEVRVWTAPGPIEGPGRVAPDRRPTEPPIPPEVGRLDPETALQRARKAWEKRGQRAR
jgi:predicted nucleic acid-binding Zn ribbon protein